MAPHAYLVPHSGSLHCIPLCNHAWVERVSHSVAHSCIIPLSVEMNCNSTFPAYLAFLLGARLFIYLFFSVPSQLSFCFPLSCPHIRIPDASVACLIAHIKTCHTWSQLGLLPICPGVIFVFATLGMSLLWSLDLRTGGIFPHLRFRWLSTSWASSLCFRWQWIMAMYKTTEWLAGPSLLGTELLETHHSLGSTLWISQSLWFSAYRVLGMNLLWNNSCDSDYSTSFYELWLKFSSEQLLLCVTNFPQFAGLGQPLVPPNGH